MLFWANHSNILVYHGSNHQIYRQTSVSKIETKFETYQLSHRYTKKDGRVFLTGTQALARIMMEQAARDRRAGLNTAGFISGYRGSPLGGLDLELWKVHERLATDKITFMPAVNEELGATAVLGAQQASLDPDCEVEGVFSMWYGKGPGVDRSGDALRHGNAYGSAPSGGVLVVAGDDHGCVSSSMPHQSDVAMMTWFMPMLSPASVEEYLEYGEYGFALSRFSGTWVGFKAISETVESGRSVDLHPDRQFIMPEFAGPPGGLHVRKADLPSPEIETRIGAKLKAVEAFVEANPIDRAIYGVKDAIFGFVTSGKGHLDLLEALRLLGLDDTKCRSLGVDIYKVAMVWPLARRDALGFVRGKKEVLVVEEKRGIIESQFKEYFYDWPGDKPEKMVGKYDSVTNPLVPWDGELSPLGLVPIVAARLDRFFPEENLPGKAAALKENTQNLINVEGATRTPYFCSGCPHNTSTKVPQGSIAASGIGCHVMASWMDRNTVGYAQMGGEGVPWIVSSKYNGKQHRFQNLGEGTWYHSGSMAIRQAVAAEVNITFKILYNDAVAMTGGQPVDGPVSVYAIAHSCRAEGVERIALVSDDPTKFDNASLPGRATIHGRAQLFDVQRELREIDGVSVLIYEQTCASEKRRRRKRGIIEDPRRFAFINYLVCEACGDCSLESNCLSVEPMETEFGRKRQINLSSCNKDFSCLNGFCPGFVTLEGAARRKKRPLDIDIESLLDDIPTPQVPLLTKPFDLLVTGVGGTGVVTIGALITMAAHLEARGASVLDFTGFAQKFGSVLSYIRLASKPDELNQVRIGKGAADALIGCDIVVSSSPKASVHYRNGTRTVLNLAAMPTGDLVLHRDANLAVEEREAAIRGVVGKDNVSSINANRASEQLLGDGIYANVIMLGFAWQKGLVPLSREALNQAIVLNGVEPEKNQLAFDYGRILAASPQKLEPTFNDSKQKELSPDELIDHRASFLADYQDVAYENRFRATIGKFREALPDTVPDHVVEKFVCLAAKSLFKLMAYKDEYEVARLHTHPAFHQELVEQFEDGFTINYHLAPPFLPLGKDNHGRPAKRSFGSWMGAALRLLAPLKKLRGTPFDPFGYTQERKMEIELIRWYENCLEQITTHFRPENEDLCNKALSAPLEMRGYGAVKKAAVLSTRKQVDIVMAKMMTQSLN